MGGWVETYAHLVVRCKAWVYSRMKYLGRYIGAAIDTLQASNQDATQKAILIMLRGGAPGCVKLDDWDFVKDDGVHYASDEDDSDADVDESSDPEGESDAQDCCCYIVSRTQWLRFFLGMQVKNKQNKNKSLQLRAWRW